MDILKMKQQMPAKIFLSLLISILMQNAMAETSEQKKINDENKAPIANLKPIIIIAEKNLLQPSISADDVYSDNESTTFKNKTDIERFMGESPSDIFKGMVGVQSGDSRNSGAIDPNVRGIQGQGRVPVTIDGTEQAITANRGYQGASNRNYIDPQLISSIEVSKGVSMQRGVQSSVGGAVTINTLNASDVLEEEQNFGVSFTSTIGNNTTRVDAINPNDYIGDNASNYSQTLYPIITDFDNNPAYQKAFNEGLGKLPRRWNTYTTPGLIGKKPVKNSRLSNIEDTAYRIAIAGRNDYIEGLVSYAYRDRGNYFSGKKGSDDYSDDVPNTERDQSKFSSVMADVYRPKQEVPNSSNKTESVLFKANYKPNSQQALQVGYRHSDITAGDIMPFRVADDRSTSMFAKTNLLPQWPLSNISQDAYNIRYKWQPDNQWIDIDANLWHTDSNTQTHNSGGDPLSLVGRFRGSAGTPEFADYKRNLINQFQDIFPDVVHCPDNILLNPDYTNDATNKCVQAAVLYGSTFKSNSATSIDNQRTGVSLSNKFKINNKLDITVSGNYQQEELETHNAGDVNSAFFTVAPGKGRRRAGDVSINSEYRPLDWLDVKAGVRYDQYWAMDDYVNEQRSKRNPRFINESRQVIGKKLDGFIKANNDIQQALQDFNSGNISYVDYRQKFENIYGNKSFSYAEVALGRDTHIIENGQANVAYVAMPESLVWHARRPNKFVLADNPYVNGTASKAGILRPAKSEGKQGRQIYRTVGYGEPWESVPEQTGWGVSPSLSMSAKLPWDGRVYTRYAQSYRMPSMFESIANFSKNLNYYEPVSPEEGSNAEIGYVQDFSNMLINSNLPAFQDIRFADAKLVYYHNRINDVIDRDLYSNLRNFDKQTIQGIELQSRIDTGKYFADFSAGYTLENKVCDADYAKTIDPYYNQVDSCVNQGFFGGFLFNMAQPKYMIDLTLGTRLLDEKLEMATRIHHHTGSDSDVYYGNYGEIDSVFTNIPYSWSPTTTLDFYINYKILKDSKLKLAVTNMTDEYYLDPISRTLIPAPGRAIQLGFTTKF